MARTGRAQRHAGDDSAAFELLQQLLAGRRELLVVPPRRDAGAVADARTQRSARGLAAAASATGPGAQASVGDIKQDLLARMRQQRGKGATLSGEDNDTFELLGMLYGQIEREVHTDAPSAPLLKQLQVPLVRLALQDINDASSCARSIPRRSIPRMLLNTVAESGARWLDRDDIDPQLMPAMRDAVDQVVRNYRDDTVVFARANDELQSRLRTIAQRPSSPNAATSRPRAARKRLEVAKRRAIDTINELVGDQRPPHFVRALLNQAWADVLTLSLLRHGAESDSGSASSKPRGRSSRTAAAAASTRRTMRSRRASRPRCRRSATTARKPRRSRAASPAPTTTITTRLRAPNWR